MFDKLTTELAPTPKARIKAEPLTNGLKTFAKQIANTTHGLIVKNVTEDQIAIIKVTLKAHSETLFGPHKVARFRVLDKTNLRIVLADAK